MPEVSTSGAIAALIIAITLILRKVPPVYGMMIGALAGGLIGGAQLVPVILFMTEGAQTIMPAVLRILAAGVLAGVLMESGAASTIAVSIVNLFGRHRSLLALCLATLILTAVGVFVDIAVIAVAPIGLAIAKSGDISRSSILLAMVGGGKCGNIISPNPNTIAVADAFSIPMSSVMAAGIIPAVFGALATYFLAQCIRHKGSKVVEDAMQTRDDDVLPGTAAALTAPLVTIFLLSLRPLAGFNIDPIVALPAGGVAGALAMGRIRQLNRYSLRGLKKMSSVAIMLIGTGTLAGIVTHSGLQNALISLLHSSGFPPFMLAPFSGALMSAATASTTAGTVVASAVFSGPLLELGISALAGAAMVHAGATVFDSLPHGSFFHATGGATFMQVKERLQLLPYECSVGIILAAVSTLLYRVLALLW